MMIEDDFDGDADIEALASLAHELSQVNMSNFAIADEFDEDEELEGDYESITTDEGDDLPCESYDNIETPGSTVTTGDDFVLAERTTQIMSTFRDYLTNIETVTAENQRLTDEMDSLRGSLGMPTGASDLSRRANEEDRCIEIIEEPRSARYSHVHSRQLKKRLLRGVVGIIAIGSLAIFSFVSAATAHTKQNQNNIPDWDLDSAVELEQEAKEALLDDANSRTYWNPPKSRAPLEEVINNNNNDSNEDNTAMMIIQAMLARPSDVTLTPAPQVVSAENIEKALGSEDYNAEEGESNSTDGYSKSGKVDDAKSDDSSDANHAKSKSGKVSSQSKYHSSKSSKVFMAGNKAGKSISSSTANHSKTGKASPAKTSSAKTGKIATAQSEEDARNQRLHLESASILYQAISNQYKPVFFDRSHGWEGKTFTEADYFCEDNYPKDMHGSPGVPCPYEAYCPEGPKSVPFGGYRKGTSFAPIIDNADHWVGFVQVSSGHSCVAYNIMDPEPSEEQSRNIMCCRDVSP